MITCRNRTETPRRYGRADLAERLLSAIIDGTCPPDAALPPEGELAEQSAVSRLTVREAVKQLRAQNVVRVVRGPAPPTHRCGSSSSRPAG